MTQPMIRLDVTPLRDRLLGCFEVWVILSFDCLPASDEQSFLAISHTAEERMFDKMIMFLYKDTVRSSQLSDSMTTSFAN